VVSLREEMILNPISRGGFSKVHHYIDGHGNRFCCKVTPQRNRKIFKNEIDILNSFPPNIRFPKIYDHYETRENCYMIMSLFRGTKVNNLERYTENTLKSIMRGISRCLVLCHENEVIHLDVKPQNLMMSDMSETALTKLIDFGNSVRGTRVELNNRVGTLEYMSPEHLTYPYRVTPKSDVWAMGVIMFLMGSGYMPFNDEEYKISEVIDNIKEMEPDYTLVENNELRELVRWMLNKNPEDRPMAVEILNHPYLKGDIWDRYQGELFPDERIEKFKRSNTMVYLGKDVA